ncbi:MAG: CoA ester lyase [Rhodospirillales bacterium]|nr:CoA ester lyase [Rhodospirillales bacterium]
MTDGPHRTYLFAPGNHPRKVEKVFAAGADAAILDLEDAVAAAEKVGARSAVVAALKRSRQCRGFVRVNAFDTEFHAGDLEAVVGPWLDGVMVPKVESPAQLQAADELLGALERRHGMAAGAVDLLPIVETAKGLAAVAAIAGAGTRAQRLSFGAVDLAKDLGMLLTVDEWELTPARAAVVLASRAAGLEAPIDTVWVHFRDEAGLIKSAEHARTLGFQGKMCIHPDQVAAVNRAFTPSDEELAKAEKIVAAFEKAEAAGSASIVVDGFFVDYPVVDHARRTLTLIKSIRG